MRALQRMRKAIREQKYRISSCANEERGMVIWPGLEDKKRERRIDMEIVVDAYDEVERAMGWYYYLQDGLKFPFKARCVEKRSTSPLKIGDLVEVIGMGEEDDCMHDMYVDIKWNGDVLSVPLSQLEGIKTSKKNKQILEDWQYWVKRGYQF